MQSRRRFVKNGLGLAGGLMMFRPSLGNTTAESGLSLYMPDEGERHRRTWMAFVANDDIWARYQIPEVKRNLILIATTIARYEPVSMLVAPDDYEEASDLLSRHERPQYPVELIQFAVDDLWLRDTGPTFVTNTAGEKIAIDFNFNGWGNKQEHSLDQYVARFIAKTSGAYLEPSNVVLEGGCFEVDGQGTAILTKSCVLNDNRNPGLTQGDIEAELKRLMGLEKIIWLDGIKGKDITDGHTDFYARFIRPGEVMVSRDNDRDAYDYEVTRENILILRNSTDAQGNPLKLHIIDTPDIINEQYGVSDFAAGYIGYYLCNGAVIAQQFGDPQADEAAWQTLRTAFPDREIEQIAIDGVASGGGSIHCTTQQEILV